MPICPSCFPEKIQELPYLSLSDSPQFHHGMPDTIACLTPDVFPHLDDNSVCARHECSESDCNFVHIPYSKEELEAQGRLQED